MKIFKIEIIETLKKTIEVKAATITEAINIAEQSYFSEDVILDYSDHSETNFYEAENILTLKQPKNE